MGNHRSLDEALTVVIRSIGERTESLCRELVAAQIASRNIFVVREQPFARAVHKTFQIGIDENRMWTLAVDADTLLLPGVLQRLYECAEAQGVDLFKVQGTVIDKFLSSPRVAGHHFYRTACLPAALRFIPDSVKDLRPETFVLKNMESQGCTVARAGILAGFHDFEQYYCDIFRKSFLQSKKHARHVALITSQWKHLACSDLDFALALAGYASGRHHRGSVLVDKDSVPMQDFAKAVRELNIQEKPSLGGAEHCIIGICQQLEALLEVKDMEVGNIKTSYSYRLGRVLTHPLRKIINPGKNKKDADRFPDK